MSYGQLAAAEGAAEAFAASIPANVALVAVKEWKVLGTPVARPNRHDLVTGAHKYPSDIGRPEMMYARVLRPPAYGAQLKTLDQDATAKAFPDVSIMHDGDFAGVVAATRFRADQAIEVLAKAATWDMPSGAVSSDALYEHLRQNAPSDKLKNPFADDVAKAAKSLKQSYHVAYIQHAPLEPRAAVAEWQKD